MTGTANQTETYTRVNENLNNAMKGLKETKFLHAVQMFLAELGDLDHEVQHPAVDGVAHPAQLGQHLDRDIYH